MTILSVSEMPVLKPLPMNRSDSLRRWRLEQEYFLRYLDNIIYIPDDFIFDGASIPSVFRMIYNPTGYLFLAGLVHDFMYKNGFYYIRTEEGITPIPVDRKEADVIFKKIANLYYENHKIKTQVAYRSLRVGGWVAWNKHRGITTAPYDPAKKYVEDDNDWY